MLNMSFAVDSFWLNNVNYYHQAIVDQKLGQYIEIEVMDEDPGEDDALGK